MTIAEGSALTAIGDYAFYGCTALTEIHYGGTVDRWLNQVTKDTNWDYNTGNYTVYCTDGFVTKAGQTAILKFEEIDGSFTVTGVDTEITSNLILVIPSTYKGKPVTAIANEAFMYCYALESIEIPASVTSIGDYAFRSCAALESIEISASVTSIGEYAFFGCESLRSLNYGGTTDQWKDLEKGDWWDENTGNYSIVCDNGTLLKGMYD